MVSDSAASENAHRVRTVTQLRRQHCRRDVSIAALLDYP